MGPSYCAPIGERLLKVGYNGSALIVEANGSFDKGTIGEYFGLKEDLPFILNSIDVDGYIHKAIVRFHGLRILNQEHWECLASYILSSYNNIPRIKKMIEGVSKAFGRRLKLDSVERYSFPDAEKIAGEDIGKLRRLGLGFRAEYLKEAARKIASGKFDLRHLEELSYEEAREKLISLKGVGEKVADCILLFSFSKYEAFPVDVWIKRGIEKLYFRGKSVPPKRITEFARDHFGRYAGYAQEYLYHYFRCKD